MLEIVLTKSQSAVIAVDARGEGVTVRVALQTDSENESTATIERSDPRREDDLPTAALTGTHP